MEAMSESNEANRRLGGAELPRQSSRLGAWARSRLTIASWLVAGEGRGAQQVGQFLAPGLVSADRVRLVTSGQRIAHRRHPISLTG